MPASRDVGPKLVPIADDPVEASSNKGAGARRPTRIGIVPTVRWLLARRLGLGAPRRVVSMFDAPWTARFVGDDRDR